MQQNRTTSHCYKCDTVKPRSEFYKHKGRSNGITAECKECSKELTKAGHKRRNREYEQLYARLHPDIVDIPAALSNPTHKICSHCLEEKPLGAFFKDNRYRFGVHGWCKDCRLLFARQHAKSIADSQLPLVPGKRCSRCKLYKTAEEFHLQTSSKGGLKSHCKACKRATDVLRMGAPARKAYLWSQYRITPEDYTALLLKQSHACGICRGSLTGLKIEIDHCHVTNKVRGLLCVLCNRWLAAIEHPTFATNAAVYLANPPYQC